MACKYLRRRVFVKSSINQLLFVVLCLGILRECQFASLPSNEQQNLYFGQLSDTYSDDGTPAQVEFITKLRSKRELTSHPYHIVKISTEYTESFSIHLIKDTHLVAERFKAVVIGEQENILHKSDVDCLYSGIISGNPGGFAALSSCDGKIGFTGHIVLGDEHYAIEPEENRHDSNTSKATDIIHHRVYRSTVILQKENNTTRPPNPDVRRVPKDEYDKAIAEFSNTTRFDNSADEETGDEPSTNSSNTSNSQTPSEINTTQSPSRSNKSSSSSNTDDLIFQDSLNDALVDMNTPGEWSPQIDTQTYGTGAAMTHQTKNIGKKKNGKGGGKKGVPKQMPVAGKKVMEIAVFTDPELYKLWTTRYPKSPKERLKSYVLNLVNNMNLLYKQPSLGVDMSFRLVYLEMIASKSKAPETFDGESDKYLTSFCKYAGEKNRKGADWDHAILLTGVNLKEGIDKSLAGLAWFSTMCLKYWSCSVSEAFSFGSTFVLAHEIGHSLGMEHDGTSPNKACSPEKFLMSPYTGEGRVTWSPCSNKNIREYIAKGSSTGEKGVPPFCLTKASPLKAKTLSYVNARGKLPGDVYKAKAQCQYDCGTACTPNSSKSEDFCRILSCKKPGAIAGMTVTKEAHPALEGTSCGNSKICRSGKCVKVSAG